jgi:restriction endonuclease S subunit
MHRNDFNIIVGKAITKVKTGIYTYKQYSYGINKEQNNLFIGNTNTGDIYQASFGMLIYN